MNWLYIILRAIIDAIRKEITFRRFLHNLKENPPEDNKWRDAVSKITTEEWQKRVSGLHALALKNTPAPPKPKPHAKRKRTKFKKHWPHDKHSG